MMPSPDRPFAGLARACRVLFLLLLAGSAPRAAGAAAPQPGAPLTIARAQGAIVLDGELDDDGWRHATPITQWYETKVATTASRR